LLNFCVKILFCKHYFSPLNTFMRKGKDPDPDPYLVTNRSGSGRPKNMRILRIRIQIPNTDWHSYLVWNHIALESSVDQVHRHSEFIPRQ